MAKNNTLRYIVGASDSDEIDYRCDHEKLDYYYDSSDSEHKLKEHNYHYEVTDRPCLRVTHMTYMQTENRPILNPRHV